MLVFVIRHGERADSGSFEEQGKIKNQIDPHLTKIGENQAAQSAEFVQEYLKNNYPSINNVRLISSPFLRCIMTAESFKKQIQLNGKQGVSVDNDCIFVEEMICEMLKETWFEENVVENMKLEVYQNKNEGKYAFLKNQKRGLLQYPEEVFQNFRERVVEGYQESVLQQGQDCENTALVLFTHGIVINTLLKEYGLKKNMKKSEIFKSKNNIFLHNNPLYMDIDYCSISLLKHQHFQEKNELNIKKQQQQENKNQYDNQNEIVFQLYGKHIQGNQKQNQMAQTKYEQIPKL